MVLEVQERIVAGGGADELVVHHLVLRGSHRAIDRYVCELVRARYGVCAAAPAAPVAGRERVRCSAAFVPPGRAPAGHPLVARTLEVAGPLGRPRLGEPPPAARPYVVELHPDEAFPSLAVCAFDLEGAALDGVNAEGLVVASVPGGGGLPGGGHAALEVVRSLLDRCATAAEARAALRAVRLRAGGGAARWLVADRSGDAFALELSEGRAVARWLDAAGEPLALAGAPDDEARTLWAGEYDALERRLSARFQVGAGGAGRGEAAELRFQLA